MIISAPFIRFLAPACLVIAGIVVLITALPTQKAQAADKKETVYERVIRTRTIRCGYNSYEPVIMRDPNTGTMSGIFPDYLDAVAKATGLTIEWTEEVGWGDVPVALQTGKIDAMCAGKWADAKDGVQIAFTAPVFYTASEAYVRADDTRFDSDLSLINAPGITISAIEGGVTEDIAVEDFPQAKILSLPVLQGDAEQLLNVTMGKADVTFANQGPASGFIKNNPDKIKRVAPDKPLRVYGVTIAVDIHEQEFLTLLNTATNQLLNSGVIDKILTKYEKDYPGAFTRVAKPYEIQKQR